MQLINAMISLGGDHGNTVAKFGITVAEVAVLQAIHGNDAVKEIEIVGSVERSHRQEIARLLAVYGRMHDGKDVSPVSTLFPGAAARVFEKLDELDIPDEFYAANSRPAKSREPLVPVVLEPVAAASSPAPENKAEEDDGIGEMTDGIGDKDDGVLG